MDVEQLVADNARLRAALADSVLVARAVGILMERHSFGAEQATRHLEQLAARADHTVLETARRLVVPRHGTSDAGSMALAVGELTLAAPDLVGTDGLSARELQVMTMIAAGATNFEIGEALHLGLNTVKTYIRTAYRKVGVTRRSQAVIWGRTHGLVAEPGERHRP